MQDGHVVLGGDLGGLLDQDPPDDVAADVHAQDPLGLLAGLGRVLGQLDAAGLAAAADLHLGLDDHGAADLGGGRLGLGRRPGDLAARDGHPVLGEQLLRLMLEQVQ